MPTPVMEYFRVLRGRRKRTLMRLYWSDRKRVCGMQPPFQRIISNCLRLLLGGSYYGGPDLCCQKCGAFFWFCEGFVHHADATSRSPVYTGCCRTGRISLPKFGDWPAPLDMLMHFGGDAVSSRFMRLIRQYNSMLCFTSLGAQVDRSINVGGATYVFKMNGVVYHRIGWFVVAGRGCSSQICATIHGGFSR